MINYSELDDNRLQELAAVGDRQAEERLVVKYMRLVRRCSRPFFLVGGAPEDLIQEGMLGLLSAKCDIQNICRAVHQKQAFERSQNRFTFEAQPA